MLIYNHLRSEVRMLLVGGLNSLLKVPLSQIFLLLFSVNHELPGSGMWKQIMEWYARIRF